MSAAVSDTLGFKTGTPTKVIDTSAYLRANVAPGRTYDVSPDGRRFLMIKTAGGTDQPAALQSITVVQNWFEELKRRVPVP